jgi:hypothetical protein
MVMPMENLMPKGDSLTGAELVKRNKSSTVKRSTATTPWVFGPTDGPSISSAMTFPIFCHRW